MKAWHSLPAKDILAQLGTSAKFGLADAEAAKRHERFGPNSLHRKKHIPTIFIFLRQFNNALIYILIAAATITLILRHYFDLYIILLAILINVIIGFIQERKAENALEHLRKAVRFRSTVIRNGHKTEIPTSKIVSGDIIEIGPGSKIPADARLLSLSNLSVNEANLTGESMPERKFLGKIKKNAPIGDRHNMVYMGTLVLEGVGKAVVVNIGAKTEFGRIAKSLAETKDEKTPLQQKLAGLSRFLGSLSLVMVTTIFIVGIILGYSIADMFVTAVALAVASIPESMVVGVTAILALGMYKILKKKALVRHLLAAETLGSTSVICADKTGTITEGVMRVSEIICHHQSLKIDHRSRKLVEQLSEDKGAVLSLKIGVLASDAYIENPEDELHEWRVFGNPTEQALIIAATQIGLRQEKLQHEYPRLDEIPFDSSRKFMAVLRRSENMDQNIIYLKGAPEKVINASSQVDKEGEILPIGRPARQRLLRETEEATNKGLRVLGVAYKLVPADVKTIDLKSFKLSGFTFVGLVGIKDPLRPHIKEVVAQTKKAGIRTVIVTGDHRLTAQALAAEVGLKASPENVITGFALNKISDEELERKVKQIKIYARVSPQDKLRIVRAWQAQREVVAMTGDGVNDAPALKAAHIGIAVGTASDVTKETSDLVLLDNNFETIVDAVEEGRSIFNNIRKIVLYVMSDAFTEIIIVAGSFFIGLPLPILAAQILWINLVDDGFSDLALIFEPPEKELMDEKPVRIGEPIINREMRWINFVVCLVAGVSVLAIFYYVWKTTGDLDHARTVAFSALAVDSLIFVFSVRNIRHSILRTNPFSNIYLILAVIAGFGMQLAAVYAPFLQKALKTVPLTLNDWGLIFAVVLAIIFFIEIAKIPFYKEFKK